MSILYTLMVAAFSFFIGAAIDRRSRVQRVECVTTESFTKDLCRELELPHPVREPCETDREYLLRRIGLIKHLSRKWGATNLAALSDKQLHIAAAEICDTTADFCQDLVVLCLLRQQHLPYPETQVTDDFRERHAPQLH